MCRLLAGGGASECCLYGGGIYRKRGRSRKLAGRPKKRIDYSGWSVDIFSNDTKIDKLLDAQGWAGFGVYFYLCQMAFGGDGYFYEWCYDLCATTARKMGGGMGAGTVRETVDYCLRIGLFDKGLFDRWGVLTSRGIQKNYLVVLKNKNRSGTQIYSEYWLLDKNKKEDYQGVIFVPKIKKSVGANDDSLAQKDSKVKERVFIPPISPAESFEQFWDVYPNKVRRSMAETAYCDMILSGMVTEEQLVAAAKNYAEYCEIQKIDKIYHPNNFISKCVFDDFLPENYKKPKRTADGKKPAGSKFNNFNQREYDYEDLERRLLQGGN